MRQRVQVIIDGKTIYDEDVSSMDIAFDMTGLGIRLQAGTRFMARMFGITPVAVAE